MFDTVIRGATVVDGTGAPPFINDVGIVGGVITEIGRITDGAHRVIDADGTVLTPGWIDGHTHYDGQVTWDDQLEGSAANGVTTIVMGNCGVGFAPVAEGDVDALIDLMEGVEDIPGTCLYEGIPWGSWESFPDYVAFLEGRSWAIDVAPQLPHGTLRFYVMGERAIENRDATPDDLARMAQIAEEAAHGGALGFSTSRIVSHRSMSGHPVPGTFAPEEELLAITTAFARGGGAVLQGMPSNGIGDLPGMEPERASLLDEVRLFARISRQSGLPFTFTTLQVNDQPNVWRDVLDVTVDENQRGAHLYPMVSPRSGTVLTTLRTYHLFMQRPTFQRLAHLPLDQLVAELRRPQTKAAILAETDVIDERKGSMKNLMPRVFERTMSLTFPLRAPVDYEPMPDQSLAAMAAAQGRDPFEFMYDFLLQDEGRAVGVFLGANYIEGHLDAVREMLCHPYTVSGLSDAGAHVSLICDMSVPTFHLTHWVRDRSRGERLPIELAVAKMTSTVAKVFGLSDRGTIAVGKRADLNVIDLDNLRVEEPELRNDLPAGGQRFLQPATGYVATFVDGVMTRSHDRDTAARPGRVARRGKPHR